MSRTAKCSHRPPHECEVVNEKLEPGGTCRVPRGQEGEETVVNVDEENEDGHPHRRASLEKTVETISHYAKLIFAEDPISQHRDYLVSLEEETARARRELARQRWVGATMSLISSQKMVKDAQVLGNRSLRGGDRLAAAIRLEMALKDNPEKKMLVRALQKRAENDYNGFGDMILNELFITGEKIFTWFTPGEIGHHRLIFTTSLGTCMFIVFFFMAGEFPFYMVRRYRGVYEPCLDQLESPYGPDHLLNWISTSGTWCFEDVHSWSLTTGYVLEWGARFGPLIAKDGNWYRWLTSMFIHQNFRHLISNLLLFIALGAQIETKYGFWRITLLWLTAHLGGALFSAALENPCTAVIGASGGVFGLMGLFIADMVMNFKTIKRPILRGLLIVMFLLYFLFTVATVENGTSHLSHLGGLLCGLFPAFLFLPKLRAERVEAWFPIVGGLVLVVVFTVLPVHIYRNVIKDVNCGMK